MAPLTAPEEREIADAVSRVVKVGLAQAQDESLAPLQTVLTVVRAASDEPISLRDLLERAIERCDDEEAVQGLPILLDLDRGGATVGERFATAGKAVQLAANTIRTDKRGPWCALLARELLEMFHQAREATRGRFSVDAALRERFETLCTLSALQLAALQRRDGSWSGADACGDGELSTTSRAAASLHKALGDEWAERVLDGTTAWILAHHDAQRGGFGDRHSPLVPPGFLPQSHIMVQPRQTASAIKMLRQFDGPLLRAVGLGVRYLVEHRAQGGFGWAVTGEPSDQADILTTAYVLDALLRIQPDLPRLAAVLDSGDFKIIDDRFETALRCGLDWLLDRCRDGGWAAEEGARKPDPYVTAQVLGFAWQVVVPRPEPTIEYLTQLCRDGGVPERDGGPPAVAPTAMALLGLLRATSEGHEALLRKGAWYLARVADRPPASFDVFAATFLLLLGQPSYEWLSGTAWQDRARAGAEAIVDGRRRDLPPDEIAASAAQVLEPRHRQFANGLAPTLETTA